MTVAKYFSRHRPNRPAPSLFDWAVLRNRFVIGASETADVRLAGDGIAPRHAQISLGATGRIELTCLGSDCTVLCNDRPVLTTTPLNDGDQLQIGGIKLHVGILTVDQPEAQMTGAQGPNPAAASRRYPRLEARIRLARNPAPPAVEVIPLSSRPSMN